MAKKAVLLLNLGSPDDPSVASVRRYLNEFLMDPCVMDLPYLFRFLLVKGIILNTRPKQSAEAYQKVWTDKGSPLIVFSHELRDEVQHRSQLPIYLAMRYGSPSISSQLALIQQEHSELTDLLVIPLYPQYAMATTLTAENTIRKAAQSLKCEFSIRVLPPFYQDSRYLTNLVDHMKPYTGEPFDHLLFSFHGLPERHLRKTDSTNEHCFKVSNCCNSPSEAHQYCYKHQCESVARHCASELQIPSDKWSVSYQSRLGNDPWIKPYTDTIISDFPRTGVQSLLVVCPAFVSDCLETLEEIEMTAKESFIAAGGQTFRYIPCLNTQSDWCDTIAQWVQGFDTQQLVTEALL